MCKYENNFEALKALSEGNNDPGKRFSQKEDDNGQILAIPTIHNINDLPKKAKTVEELGRDVFRVHSDFSNINKDFIEDFLMLIPKEFKNKEINDGLSRDFDDFDFENYIKNSEKEIKKVKKEKGHKWQNRTLAIFFEDLKHKIYYHN